MFEALAFREIRRDDIDELAAAVADAFVGYRVFAPGDWQPPPANEPASVLQWALRSSGPCPGNQSRRAAVAPHSGPISSGLPGETLLTKTASE